MLAAAMYHREHDACPIYVARQCSRRHYEVDFPGLYDALPTI
jgi:hypothetical protein